MKNFESTFNRWLDGSLDEKTRREFEATLDEETLRTAKNWPATRTLLKDATRQISLPHPDFLNEQIRRAIASPGTSEPSPVFLFPLRRLLWAGAACVGISIILSLLFFPVDFHSNSSTMVVFAETSAPGLSASVLQPGDTRGVVIWTDGMPFIPDGKHVQ